MKRSIVEENVWRGVEGAFRAVEEHPDEADIHLAGLHRQLDFLAETLARRSD